jgi:hypothetical protein
MLLMKSKLALIRKMVPTWKTLNSSPPYPTLLKALASSALTSQSMLLQMPSNQAKTMERTSRSFKKIPTKYQNMLLVASSTGEARSNALNDTVMEFFSQANSFNAQIILNSLLEEAMLQVSVYPAVATLLFNGSFLWTNCMTPSGFLAVVLSSENAVLRSDTFEDALVLNLSMKFEMSAASLSKLTKTQLVLPKSVDNTIERLKALKILANHFFSDDAPIPQGLLFFVNWCEVNKILLYKEFYLDDQYLAKIILAIDDRIFQWLKQCCAPDAGRVTLSWSISGNRSRILRPVSQNVCSSTNISTPSMQLSRSAAMTPGMNTMRMAP